MESMMSQDSVTDSELLEMNIDFPTMEESRPFVLHTDTLIEEQNEDNDNADSKVSSLGPSSILTVANADEIQTVIEEDASGDQEVSIVKDDQQESCKTPTSEEKEDIEKEPNEESLDETIAQESMDETITQTEPMVDDEKQESSKETDDEHESQPLDKPEEVSAVGATPFEDHEEQDEEEKAQGGLSEAIEDKSTDVEKEEEKGEQIMLYYSKGSYTSEKVLVYLYERGIHFTSFNVDLSKGEQFSKWFLKINPKAEVPVLTIKDPSRDPRDPRHLKILTDSTRIMHSVDAKFAGDLPTPNLVPASSDTLAYQHHVYFTAIFDQIPLNIISHGIAFHDHLAIEPESPYYEANYEGIREMGLNREEIINEAAIGYAAFIASDTDIAVMELRKKAR